ncbi:glycosyltransferase [Aquiflexum sp. TKW24L]|uniref:glycosyltransferase n=1 Tax=Aquiflexum sp. TKW24L TaxID=2942212 RepID=UPI0020C182C0|nr:glycosyltransferase [Aquiflexum sp. TKW24L]MCL6261006.1 glycosyltransferase [Aquiflexum sp. TKW24L]
MSRMAHDFKILFIEEPLPKAEKSNSIKVINNNLHVLQPNITDLKELSQVLSGIIGKEAEPIAWFYSPSFCGVLEEFNFSTVVYDCMDELPLFNGSSPELNDQELLLLKKSSVVFTGGKSLFEAKFPLHNNVFCFPCSVDMEHFSIATNTIGIPEDLLSITTPIIGFFGILDERIDMQLIEETARFLPEYSFVFVGPVVKIRDEDLPKLPNIHYLGIKPYSELPHFLKSFDIAMMPFALNGSTKYVSPTITLEYMAAGKPIISTKVSDVERDYSGCIRLISSSSEFASDIQKILSKEITPKVYLYDAILNKTSWDRTVNKMKAILKENVKG